MKYKIYLTFQESTQQMETLPPFVLNIYAPIFSWKLRNKFGQVKFLSGWYLYEATSPTGWYQKSLKSSPASIDWWCIY